MPFFSPACGESFRALADFPQALDRFLTRRPQYDPRGYVRQHLSPAQSARIYRDAYTSLLPAELVPTPIG